MTSKKNSQAGMSLIETLVYVTLTIALVTVFSVFVSDMIKKAALENAKNKINTDTRFILADISRQIKTAKSVTVASSTELVITDTDGQVSHIYWDGVKKTVVQKDTTAESLLTGRDVLINLFRVSAVMQAVKIDIQAEKRYKTNYGVVRASLSTLATPRRLIY